MKVIALAGLSGVGKTTFLKSLNTRDKFVHLEASKIIKLQKAALEGNIPTSEDLRLGDLDDNQKLLILGIEEIAKSDAELAVLDCHTVIDDGKELIRITSDVFKTLGVKLFVFLQGTPAKIKEHREKDSSRERPLRSEFELMEHQNVGISHTEAICAVLNIPCKILTNLQSTEMDEILENFLTVDSY
ncbi:MAG: AAA family ATPase [Pseudomonadota bacterium]